MGVNVKLVNFNFVLNFPNISRYVVKICIVKIA